MILIGQYDSPFVRRVGIALRIYEIPFDHKPWSVFSDVEAVRSINPLMRVPTLELDDGFVLTDSHMILDYLDGLVATPMFPRNEPARHRALKVATLGTGLAEKAVSLFYERVMHEITSASWANRCALQIGSVLGALETERAGRPGRWWFGARLGHADIAVACAWSFVTEAHPGVDLSGYPALRVHAAACEALPAFMEIKQAFVPPP